MLKLLGEIGIYDVIIAGYGPTGAVAANLLGAAGARVLVIEPNADVYDIPRAVHFDGEVMRIFQQMGLATAVGAVATEGKKISFTNGRNWKLFEQDLACVPRHNGWFNNLFFNQPRLEATLRDGVARYSNVTLRLGSAVSGLQEIEDGVRVDVITDTQQEDAREQKATESIDARYLLACDGASSPVRQALGIEQEDLQCDEPWLVCDLMLPEGVEIDRGGLQICDPARPTTLIPCAGNHIRWEFMLNAQDDVAGIEQESAVRDLMAPHLWRLSPKLNREDGELVRAKVYNFHALIAETFQRGPVFLLGDAAHQTPPFLGQGLCSGVRDAYNLCWKLVGVLRGDCAPELLQSYSTERRPHVKEVIATAVTHGGIIQARNPLKALLRDCYLMLGRAIPLLVSFLKFGEGWTLGKGLFVVDGAPAPGGPVGEPLPQGRVERPGGPSCADTLWSDELLGPAFTLVGFDVDPQALLAGSNMPDWLTTLHLGSHGEAREIDGELMNWAARHRVLVALVRPDRQVYGVSQQASVAGAEIADMIARLGREFS